MNFPGAKGTTAIEARWFWLALAMLSTLLSLLGLKGLSITSEESVSHPGLRPNIVMIVADDLGYNDISSINSQGINTPAIDQLAKEGVLFTRHYADSVCAPSRVGLLTGREPERSGFRPGGPGIPAEFITLPESLADAGYKTRLVGKWHAGTAHRRSWPDRHGFQSWFGFLDQWRIQVPVEQFGKQAKPNYRNPWLQRDGALPEKHKGHLTDILTRESVSFIHENSASSQPWFLYHAFLAPHAPIQPAPRFARKFDDSPEGRYRALVTQLDDSVGQIMDSLRETGSLDNTLVVLLSDNGGTNTQLDNNYPFKGSKNQVYEGSFRTPLLIHWPAQLAADVVDQLVHNIDLYPTILAALSLPNEQQLDGISFWEASRGIEGKGRSSENINASATVRIWEKYFHKLGTMGFSVLSADGQWRLSSAYGRNFQLFNLHGDPTGYTDVAAENPEVVDSLMTDYSEARRQHALVPLTTGDPWSARRIAGFDQMRVSDEYGQTIVFELKQQDLSGQSILISQDPVWKLSIGSDKRLKFESSMGELRGFDFPPGDCSVVGLTFERLRPSYLGVGEGVTRANIYINGHLQDGLALPSVLPRLDIWSDTVIDSRQVGETRFFNNMAFGASDTLPYHTHDKAKALFSGEIEGKPFYPALEDLSVGLCSEGVL